MSDSKTLYKVLPLSEWEVATAEGVFSGSGIDLTDGFIHLSSEKQIVSTVQRYFAGQPGLALIAFDPSLFSADLRWEPSRDGELFPHVYGVISVAAALDVFPLLLDASGKHQFPDGL